VSFWSLLKELFLGTRSTDEFSAREPQSTPSANLPQRRRPVVRGVPRFDGRGSPPTPSWIPCHASTLARFKAELTCPYGHGLILRGHSVSSEGIVHPSVVCPHPGCSFHEFVRLDGWSFGPQAGLPSNAPYSISSI
jgi:hypothetical protein